MLDQVQGYRLSQQQKHVQGRARAMAAGWAEIAGTLEPARLEQTVATVIAEQQVQL